MKTNCYTLKISAVFLISLTFISCTSTIKEIKNVSTQNLDTKDFFDIPESEDCFIFFRLYDPVYKNPLYIANLLKSGIAITEVNSFNASHIAISFNLDDCFLGLTSLTMPQLNFEICSQESDNEYMQQCDKEKSKAYIYALKVTPQEQKKAMKIIQDNLNVQYDSKLNFIMADKSIKRFLSPFEENRKFENYYSTGKNIEELNFVENLQDEKKFVCSTFVAYVLYNSVDSIREFFNNTTIDYHYVGVTDITCLPGVEKLFECTWADYELSAQNFAYQNDSYQPFVEDLCIVDDEDKNNIN
ncbi:MAG: hypothetical protein K5829_05320 [Treponema sp.]|nr:hypothetical protein [Treponema sp.]